MSNSSKDSMMRSVSVLIVSLESATMMTIIPIPIGGKSFTRTVSDYVYMAISGLAGTDISDYS